MERDGISIKTLITSDNFVKKLLNDATIPFFLLKHFRLWCTPFQLAVCVFWFALAFKKKLVKMSYSFTKSFATMKELTFPDMWASRKTLSTWQDYWLLRVSVRQWHSKPSGMMALDTSRCIINSDEGYKKDNAHLYIGWELIHNGCSC